ncbi:hypothetical protein BCR37DRAFT_403090 [Protomyces lactucae-debilis]|uniref:DUF1014-domain-containing protein n=1 Tax=Protomyces lactucae-debilis TaxID=2754530 RepID=A0A1Y2F973_PROLT|nr:uncharacterized protein BCR37DRAFT_403090 [Protomyces lactucae-debilis]ORY80451.1 hypothetical protein BCR37DRAFT_403090 [Protomyces lactucae-debilis]
MPNPKKRAEKAEAASGKKNAAESVKKAAQEDEQWSKGAKGTSKADKDAEKRAEQLRKKEEKAKLEAEEAKSLPSKPTAAARGADKAAARKTGKIDDFMKDAGLSTAKAPGLSATNIDDALDALTLSSKANKGSKGLSASDIDRHPERRFKAAYAAFEERRIAEMKAEKSGLRLQQMKDVAYKEFSKHPDNPFNQVTADHNASKEELAAIAAAERKKVEDRLAK